MKISFSAFLTAFSVMAGLSFSPAALAVQTRTTAMMRYCEKLHKWLPADEKVTASKPSSVRRAQ